MNIEKLPNKVTDRGICRGKPLLIYERFDKCHLTKRIYDLHSQILIKKTSDLITRSRNLYLKKDKF